ncbi:hypothetical protein I33_0475 [Bacillus subtilis subsp. subtilis str. RO-NN-1]|nr:hypothetical protein I33_0475 [Bacillus subtilis subsp. subtilis str. RO-NN-1]AFI26970.1 hypothetical protein MY9_0431 [Bacillus sp. JS]AKN12498.1 hypothetical protein ABU16_1422 [Bacillus subtilis]EME04987.1 hypothetical protein BS732_4298 [Bacillus subtilis MB73/2]RPJ98989.1 hypothetical protein EH11_03841 [Bacillus subtilis]
MLSLLSVFSNSLQQTIGDFCKIGELFLHFQKNLARTNSIKRK